LDLDPDHVYVPVLLRNPIKKAPKGELSFEESVKIFEWELL
jgi:hypothetical protein